MMKFLLLLCLCGLPCGVWAQSTGILSGRVYAQETGTDLTGVTIILQGTSLGAVSDVDGQYMIREIPAGTYTVIFRCLGFQTQVITDVHIKPGQNTLLKVGLRTSASTRLSEVVVTASFRQNSIQALYADRKKEPSISDGVSADMIARSPDKHMGDVLQRISGVGVEQGKFAVVRGLSARYNETLLNSAPAPSTEPDVKAFSFDIIPSEMVDRVVVYKTLTPDKPGDAAGGTIQVRTRDFPVRPYFSFSLGTGYQSLTTWKDFYADRSRGSLDFLGFDDGSRDLPGAFQQVRSQYASLGSDRKILITQQFPNTFGIDRRSPSMPPLSLQLAAGNTYVLHSGKKIGYITAISYHNSHQVRQQEQAQYLLNKEEQYHYQSQDYQKNVRSGLLFNLAYSSHRSKITWMEFFSNDFHHDMIVRTGNIFVNANDINPIYSLNAHITQQGLYMHQFTGTHQVGSKNIRVHWAASYGRSYRTEPDQRILTLEKKNGYDNYALYLSNENSPAVNTAARIYSTLHEDIYNGQLNVDIPFQWKGQSQLLKAGVSEIYRQRQFDILALGYASDLDPYGRGATIEMSKNVTIENLFSDSSIDRYRILLASIPQNTKDYTGKSHLSAAYAMMEHHFHHNAYELVWGVRMEHYLQQLISLNQPTQRYENMDVLPSVNMTYHVSNRTDIRMGYYRSVNRPEFRELAVYRYYDYDKNFIVSGNSELRRSLNDNIDLRLEYYPALNELLSFSIFYKHFQRPIEQVNLGNNVLSYDNAESAHDYGVELEVNKRLDFLMHSSFWKHVFLYGNFSLIGGSVDFHGQTQHRPLQGLSKYIFNAGVSYNDDQGDFSFSVLFNRNGERMVFRGENDGLDTYERPKNMLDVQLSKKFMKHFQFRCTISNLLLQKTQLYYKYGNTSHIQYDPGNDRIVSSANEGFTLGISIRYLITH